MHPAKNTLNTYFKITQQIAMTAAGFSLIALGFFLPISISGVTITLILTLLFAIYSGELYKQGRLLLSNPILLAALFLFLLLLISISYSKAPWQDISSSLGKYQKLIYLFFLMPLFINPRWQKVGINAFLAAMLVTLSASFLKKWGWLHYGGEDLSNLFTNHINTSFFMSFAAFILAHRCLQVSKFRWSYVIWLLLTCYQLFFMNEGRTGYFVFIPLLTLFLWQKLGWKGLGLACVSAPILFALVWAVAPNFRERIQMINIDLKHYQERKLDGNSVGLRMQFTKNSLELIQQHPWIGTGVGSFRTEYRKNFPPDPGFANLNNPQNEFLMIGVQLGLVGIVAFLGLLFLQWCFSFALPQEIRPLAQGLIVAFAVGSWSDTFLYLAYTGYFFIYFTALFYASVKFTVKGFIGHSKQTT